MNFCTLNIFFLKKFCGWCHFAVCWKSIHSPGPFTPSSDVYPTSGSPSINTGGARNDNSTGRGKYHRIIITPRITTAEHTDTYLFLITVTRTFALLPVSTFDYWSFPSYQDFTAGVSKVRLSERSPPGAVVFNEGMCIIWYFLVIFSILTIFFAWPYCKIAIPLKE